MEELTSFDDLLQATEENAKRYMEDYPDNPEFILNTLKLLYNQINIQNEIEMKLQIAEGGN